MDAANNTKRAIEQDFLGKFLSSPFDATIQAIERLRELGYFDLSLLYRQFYDPSVALIPPTILFSYLLLGALVFIAYRAALPSDLTLGKYLFPPGIIHRQSFQLDVQWFALAAIKGVSAITAVIGMIFLLRLASNYLAGLGYSEWSPINGARIQLLRLPTVVRGGLLFLSMIVTMDFINYWQHRLFHAVPILWNFHKIHHYPRQISLLTSWRVHPAEQAILDFINKLGLALMIALWSPLYSSQEISGYEEFIGIQLPILGAVVAVQGFFHAFNHSTLYIHFGSILDRVFYSPSLHLIHHARDLPNRNFANIFSFWDGIFGTLYVPKDVVEHFQISQRLGVPDIANNHYKTVIHAIVLPFLDCIPKRKKEGRN